MNTHYLQYTHHLNDKKGFLGGSHVGPLVQAMIVTSIKRIRTAKGCVAENVIAGGGCVVTAAGIESVMIMMFAVKSMATSPGAVLQHLMYY